MTEIVNEATGEVTTKRRMPDNLRRYLIRMQGGKMYLPAAYRIVWFRDEMGDEWGIRTTLIEGGHGAGFATVHAEIINPDGRVIASGHKTESKQDFAAGWVEKAESGAVARALAFLGFGTQFTSDLDEGSRIVDSPQPFTRPAESARTAQSANTPGNGHTAPVTPANGVWAGPGQRASCHCPTGKPHSTKCTLTVAPTARESETEDDRYPVYQRIE